MMRRRVALAARRCFASAAEAAARLQPTASPTSALSSASVATALGGNAGSTRNPASRLPPSVIKDQLSELLKRSSEGGGLGLETVKDVKGVLYNARAAKDARLTVAIVQRFVEPQIANATVDPAVFTLVLQVLGDVDELPLAIKLFDVLSNKKGVNLQHVCTLLNAMRQANLRDARDGRDAAQAVSARISQGLDTYYRAALASLPGAEGSVLLAMSTLSLVNTANKELLRTPEGLGWLQQARDIVARLERLNVVNPVVSGHLMVLVAKVGGAQGLAEARRIADGLQQQRQSESEGGEQEQGITSPVLYSLTLAALESRDFQACQDLYESLAPKAPTVREAEFLNYVRACAGSAGPSVLKGLEAMLQWAALHKTKGGEAGSSGSSSGSGSGSGKGKGKAKGKVKGGGEAVPQSSAFTAYLSLLYRLSLDPAKTPQTPELKRAQHAALRLLDESVSSALGHPFRVAALPFKAVAGPLSVHLTDTGRLEELLRWFPRPSDYGPADRDVALRRVAGTGGNPDSPPSPFPLDCFKPGSKIFEFWSELASGLRYAGKWRNLLSLNARVQALSTVSSRDRLVVLGHCLYALAAAGRGSEEEMLRLLRACDVVQLVKCYEQSGGLLLQRGTRGSADEAVLPFLFRFLALEAGVSSPKMLAHAMRKVTSAHQVEALQAVLDGLGAEQRNALLGGKKSLQDWTP